MTDRGEWPPDRGESLEEALGAYRELLGGVDRWFGECAEALGPRRIRCRAGCSACCRGLFDVTLLDAALLQDGFRRLPMALREEVLTRCRSRLAGLRRRWPGFTPPYILNGLPEAEWTEMPEDDPTPCPLLGPDGRCVVYASRPMTCRLHGLPNIDLSGESFGDAWCSRNFPGEDPRRLEELRWRFRETFTAELKLFRRFTSRLLGVPHSELDTFIPTALLIDFPGTDWRKP